ncbi:MAG: tRNA pseudouridine(38-40) synthase TruA [Micavibrio aeruginosavorus]|uniref:tRNA pseudouridine synthase A n=1 Tax=Micavibrio aeruginosavorus TaxID=349221 RepID=A0A2W5N6N7_9BACT|nr:MAG: tRNA pseudouridine(38-40) synthase TruA [Micavibrio aeruginosavorus]
MTRWKLTIEYDGSPYCGWQRQDGQPSVQQCIEEAIFKFCQQDIRIHAAGRTDTGVHGLGQVAHFDLDYGDRALSGHDLAKAINAHLRPEKIAILKAEETDPEFHARFDAVNKLYRYNIINRNAPLTVDHGLAWQVWKNLDANAMHDAAQVLLGQHDFTTFRDSECQAKSPVRTLDRIEVKRDGDLISMEVEARSFLHHQVRNTIGTLVLVGEGKWTCEDFKKALEAKDRTKGGMTAPPDGLYLVRIDY